MSKKLMSKPELCVSCRICEMSCSLEKSGMFSPVKARIWIQKNRKGQYQPVICRQCSNAPCEKACPVEKNKPISRDKESGIVRLNIDTCIGCYDCVSACPFGAMRIDPGIEKVQKCDLCNGDPECVKWCPTGAVSVADTKAINTIVSAEKV